MTPSRRGFLRSLAVSSATGIVLPRAFAASAGSFRPDKPDGLIRLNRNENAYGPSPKVVDVIGTAVANSNRYSTQPKALVEKIAALHQVRTEQVLLGCGSTEILRSVACAYLGAGKQLLQASPTFGALERYARGMGAQAISVGLTPSFAHNTSAMLERTSSSTAVVYVCNPNNPTATLTPRKDLENFIAKLPSSALIVIDEAYHHFAGRSALYASFIDRPVDDSRVVVTRSFSKAYGLAGLRIGYAVAPPKIAERLRMFLTEDNINSIASQAALAAMDDGEAVDDFVQRNANAKQEFFNQAMARALKPIDSHANFVMMDTLHPTDEVAGYFRRSNILIGRAFPPMNTHIRVSLGRPEEMLEFWRVWDTLPYPKHTMHH